jgi:hypothetical protein
MENTKKQQTAVEWLAEQYEKLLGKAVTTVMSDEIAQAKEMDKQQKIDAYDYHRCIGNFENGEQYYNETYGKNN